MKRIKHINIPQPCREDWQEMTPVEQGRHCQSCCKTVIDFAEMSNAEVIGYLSAHKNTCGRITGSKMAAINHELVVRHRKRFTWKSFITAASLSMLFPILKAEAQSPPKTEQAPVSSNPLGKVAFVDTVAYITIKGVIKAKDEKLPVPGASIVGKGMRTGTQSLQDGSFTLRVPADTKRILVSFIGYQTKEIKLRRIPGLQTVVLNPVLDPAFSGGFDVVYY